VTPIIQTLFNRDLIDRQTSAVGHRRIQLSITGSGRALLRRLAPTCAATIASSTRSWAPTRPCSLAC
jgi:DNA-binding MarR family transcriptional regulator